MIWQIASDVDYKNHLISVYQWQTAHFYDELFKKPIQLLDLPAISDHAMRMHLQDRLHAQARSQKSTLLNGTHKKCTIIV